ncbi:hypothetical protein ACTFIY_007336 [Dictyostelium cf. discoideum]
MDIENNNNNNNTIINNVNNNNNNSNNNSNNNDSNINDVDYNDCVLFFKIWRNKYLRYRIFHQMKKSSINRIQKYNNCEEIENLENSYYIKHLKLVENSPIPINGIPNSVRLLRLNCNFNHKLLIGSFSLSKRLEILILGEIFNQTIERNLLPNSLKKIKFGLKFNQSLQHLPSSVTSIKVSGSFLKPETIPSTVTELKLYFFFNKENLTTNDIPKSIKSLKMDICFNNIFVVGFIPNSVTKLVLGPRFFECSLKAGIIPNSVTDLTISLGCLLSPIKKGVIPNSVKNLKIVDLIGSISFNLKKGSIPNGVEYLDFIDFQSNQLKLDRCLIPFSVKQLIINNTEIDLSTLKHYSRFTLFFKKYYPLFLLLILILLFALLIIIIVFLISKAFF